jgi:hypothetical protein
MRSPWSPFHPTPGLPGREEIERRRKELLAFEANSASTGPLPEREAEPLVHGDQGESFLHRLDGKADPAAPAPEDPPHPILPDAALHGLPGRIVRALAPHTEADPAAILLQFLVALGNLLGRAPYCRVGPTRHGLNLFLVLVGESSKARKGTSWRQIANLFAGVDPDWSNRRILSTRPSASVILDILSARQTTDRRLFLLAEEFASVLQILTRENSHLSPLLRCAWDGADLSTHNGHRGLEISGAHISLVGHITQGELAPLLGRAESHNGFANRCLWAAVRRSQLLPEGGSLPTETQHSLAQELRAILSWAKTHNDLLFSRTGAARTLWREAYPQLAEGRADAYGAATSRAEAQVLRLSALYAAADQITEVDTVHLQAALALWDYCRASARLLFDTAPINPIARRIDEALGLAPEGLSRSAIRALFHGHVSKERIDMALQQLQSLGLMSQAMPPGRGRRGTLWARPLPPAAET